MFDVNIVGKTAKVSGYDKSLDSVETIEIPNTIVVERLNAELKKLGLTVLATANRSELKSPLMWK